MVTCAIFLAALLPFGVWPEDVGPPEEVVSGVEFYTTEPEDDFLISAILPVSPALADLNDSRLVQLAGFAKLLEADAVLLLGESDATKVPRDRELPLPTTGRWSVAVFLVFISAEDDTPDDREVLATCGRAAVKAPPFASRI